MTARELRLRQRIDALLDDRNRLNVENEVLRRRLTRAYVCTAHARAVARTWRLRALQDRPLGRATPRKRNAA